MINDANLPTQKLEAADLPPEPKVRKQISLVLVPSDRDVMAEEMEELFAEDKVTHQQGNSEPEAD
jgi:hypothetical protein